MQIIIGFLFIFCVGCSSSITMKTVEVDTVSTEHNKSILGSSSLSRHTQLILALYGLRRDYRENGIAALGYLEKKVRDALDRNGLLALAEISYALARKAENREKASFFYAQAVRYSYFYLFGKSTGKFVSPFDPRIRLACDLYNQSLRRYISPQVIAGQMVPLCSLDVTYHNFLEKPYEFASILFAADFEFYGVHNDYYKKGLGVALIVRRSNLEDSIKMRSYCPATLFARVSGSFKHTIRNKISLEIHNPLRQGKISINGQEVPLEANLTAPIFYDYIKEDAREIPTTGLFHIDKALDRTGIYLSAPYERGKIPVLMVHGILSSPETWMQMFNDLQGDPLLRERYQFWFFLYPTGNPLLYSTFRLRMALEELRKRIDPCGADPALQQMIVIGHSMGGVMGRLLSSDIGTTLWDSFMRGQEAKISPKSLAFLKEVLIFRSSPFIRRAIFIASPHGGSEPGTFGSLARGLITLPSELVEVHADVTQLIRQKIRENENWRESLEQLLQMPTGIDSISPLYPVVVKTRNIPLHPRVKYHSIMGNVYQDYPKKDWSDGVVRYQSAHLPGACSEIVVATDHSCTTHPLVIQEVKRILLLHLYELGR